MKFEITAEDQVRVSKWLTETVYPDVIAKQRATMDSPSSFVHDCWDAGYPYEGASGGGLTYEFTPTSLGLVTTARYGEAKLDLTDYDLW